MSKQRREQGKALQAKALAAHRARLENAGKNFKAVHTRPGTTYRDASAVMILPTRGMLHWQAVSALWGLMPMMNQKFARFIVPGDEVGVAYTETIKSVLAHPQLSKYKYIFTVEDDNLPPPNALQLLVESIESFKFDAVSGIYFIKGDGGTPQAYGDPNIYRTTGELEFRPRDIREALLKGQIMEVNGIAMGCALYRMDLFRELPAPWFKTLNEITNEGPKMFTQDLYFCEKAKRAGKRFGVDMRCAVGHLDIQTGEIY